MAFYTRVVALFRSSDGSEIERQEFWDRVAFLNYVPLVVGRIHSATPTSEMWKSAALRFFRLLGDLRPTHVLSLGQRQWNHIVFPPGWASDEAIGCGAQVRRWTDPNGASFAATWINHPSSRGFTVAK